MTKPEKEKAEKPCATCNGKRWIKCPDCSPCGCVVCAGTGTVLCPDCRDAMVSKSACQKRNAPCVSFSVISRKPGRHEVPESVAVEHFDGHRTARQLFGDGIGESRFSEKS